jgi:hypothetical protein
MPMAEYDVVAEYVLLIVGSLAYYRFLLLMMFLAQFQA